MAAQRSPDAERGAPKGSPLPVRLDLALTAGWTISRPLERGWLAETRQVVRRPTSDQPPPGSSNLVSAGPPPFSGAPRLPGVGGSECSNRVEVGVLALEHGAHVGGVPRAARGAASIEHVGERLGLADDDLGVLVVGPEAVRAERRHAVVLEAEAQDRAHVVVA